MAVLTIILATVEFVVVVAFALAAVILRAIDGRGFLASTVVGFVIICSGGISWFVIVAVFFTLGVAFTLYKYGYKRRLGSAQEKGGTRSWPNILANGGVASVIALLSFTRPTVNLSVLFLGAISTSAADTVATELGLLSHEKPRLITNLAMTVTPGTSGGVSWLGILGAVFASFIIGSMAFFLGLMPTRIDIVPICVTSGVLGATFDSVLGATVQRKGHCLICNKPTEAPRHCGESTQVRAGVRYVDNNLVNLMATVVGAAASFAVFLVLMLLG
jgi:uncharacterized protein (TIGR00297 family)